MSADPHWKEQPDDHDYPAAESYLSLLMTPPEAKAVAARLRKAPLQRFKAKDLSPDLRQPLPR